MDSLPTRPIVVFYDSCVPRRQFEAIVPRVALFAEHIFVRDRFTEKVIRNDRFLFEKAVEETESRYGKIPVAIFVTVDRRLARQVKTKPGYGNIVIVVCLSLGTPGSKDTNWRMAVKFASQLAWICGKIRERAIRKREDETSFHGACREIVGECFPPQK